MKRQNRITAANSTYKKLAVQWLNEALCFVSSFVVADSSVLRNRQLLVAANRWGTAAKKEAKHKALALSNTTEPDPAENSEKGGSQCRPTTTKNEGMQKALNWLMLAFRDFFDLLFDPVSLHERGQEEERLEEEERQKRN